MPVILDADEVLERLTDLRAVNDEMRRDATRLRVIMRGGLPALIELLGSDKAASLGMRDLPVAHLMDSGLTRLAQRVGHLPDTKVDQRADLDTKAERKKTERIARIVIGMDERSGMDIQLAQLGRWLPGYGFGGWVIREGRDLDGAPYPDARLRNPIDMLPGDFGVEQQPDELAVVRRVSPKRLARAYPALKSVIDDMMAGSSGIVVADRFGSVVGAPPLLLAGGDTWDANAEGIVVAEYMDRDGTYVVVPQLKRLIDFIPNPLRSGPAFVVARRITFDGFGGQYEHVIGLMSLMTKYNIMAMLGSEDATFRETNVIGEVLSGRYQKGRKATNYMAQGSKVEKPQMDAAVAAVFSEVDRIERQFRIAANYNVIEDAQSPNSFVTGQGLDRLSGAADNNVREYQKVLRRAMQLLDARRLEWDERVYGGRMKPTEVSVDGRSFVERYDPKVAIRGRYKTRRVFGVMAGWDEPQKIVSGLQLLQAGVIDIETFQENLDGLEQLTRINERNLRLASRETLLAMLSQRAGMGDPTATLALVQMTLDPSNVDETLRKFFTPEEPQPTPAEAQQIAPDLGQPGDSVTTLLSRLEASGAIDQGVQTVGRI